MNTSSFAIQNQAIYMNYFKQSGIRYPLFYVNNNKYLIYVLNYL